MKKILCLVVCAQMSGLAYAQQELATLQNQLTKLTQEIEKTPKPKKAVVMSTPAAPAPRVDLAAADYIKYLDEEIPKLKNAPGVSAETVQMLEGIRELLKAGRPVESVIPEAPAISGDVPVAPPAPVIESPKKVTGTPITSVKPTQKASQKDELMAAIRKGTALKKAGAAPAAKEAGRDALLKAIQQGSTLKKVEKKKTAQPLSEKELLTELTKKFSDASQVKVAALLAGHVGDIVKYLKSVDWKSLKERTTVIADIDAQVTKLRTSIQKLLANKAVVDAMKDLTAFVNNEILQAKLAARARSMEGEEEEVGSTWETE